MTERLQTDAPKLVKVPAGIPDNRLTLFIAYIKRQPQVVRISVAVLLLLIVVAAVVFAYVSLFVAHPASHHTGATHAASGSSSTSKNTVTHATGSAPTTSSSNSSQVSATGTKSVPDSPATSTKQTVYPAAILNLTNWKLTLPTGQANDADEVSQPQLATYSLSPYFQLNAAGDGVQFEAPIGGSTTSGSNFPRSELREMTDNGQQEASWSTTSGTSVMTVRESIDHLPTARPELVAAQIHGPSAYVILIRLNGSDLFVEGSDGKNLGDLDTNYTLGTVYTLQITASNGHILVAYNGAQKADDPNSTSGDYFKAGCYTQSNPSYGDNSSAYGQTTIYSLSVSHS